MPRKTRRPGVAAEPDAAASMRPRPDAAENLRDPACAMAGISASMRPRPDAAENPAAAVWRRALAAGASMRPRPDAAENHGPPSLTASRAACFNEAAARCRGKPKSEATPEPSRRPLQ